MQIFRFILLFSCSVLSLFITIFFSYSSINRNAPITSWRRTENKDIPAIKCLLTKSHTYELFGNINVTHIVYNANLSLIQENKNGDIVSHVALCSYPNIPAVPSNFWLEWAWTLYRVTAVTVRNTLFIHLLVWDHKYSNEFLGLLLQSIFINCFYLQYILLVVPPGAKTVDIFEEHFTRILPLEETDFNRVQTLLICMRQHYVPRLKLRRTKEEDNDDLVAILNEQTAELREYYGDYHIAEMVAYPDYERQMLTAEHNNKAIGIMCLSKNIDYALLNEGFELGPFHGLSKYHKRAISEKGNKKKKESEEENEKKEEQEGEVEEAEQENEEKEDTDIFSDESSKQAINTLYNNEMKPDGESSSVENDKSTENIEVGQYLSSIQEIFKKERISKCEPQATDSNLNFQCSSEENAFKVELFALQEDWDDRYCFDFLMGAFTCYPDLDYCIIAFPSKLPNFALLEHFVRVTPKRTQDFDQELYICHRNSILSELIVRPVVTDDLPTIAKLIQDICGREHMFEDCISAISTTSKCYHAYLLTSEYDLVGLAVLCPEDDELYFRAHYDIDMYMDFNMYKYGMSGIIKHLTMSPVFSNHTRFFLQEICRLSDFSNLYYQLYPDEYDTGECAKHGLITALTYMIPLKPRPQINYDLSILGKNIPEPSILQNQAPFALYYMNVHNCSIPKLFLGAKIVVVGASETAFAFLETLLYGPSSLYFGFNNITLVSTQTPELPFTLKALQMLFVNKTHSTPEYLSKISLRTWVNFVKGRITGIKRQEKYIIVNGKSTLSYDYLFLFCGVQYQLPQMNPYSDSIKCIHGKRAHVTYELPLNVFIINDQLDALRAFYKLKQLILYKNQYTIIVYGKSIHVYCCIAALREYGVPGENITLIEPHGISSKDAVYITNYKVYEAVLLSLKEEGVTVLSGYTFVDWYFSSMENSIKSITFKQYAKVISLECSAMFYYGEIDVSLDVFNALHEDGLVYDGRLVIDCNFRTNDPNIFAAGPLTKYARRFYADKYMHSHYNSWEIGKKLGEQMLEIWDPMEEKCTLEEILKTIPPIFKKPYAVSCTLLQGFNYLSIIKPGNFPVTLNEEDCGIILETGDCRSENGYFRIHISSYNMVDEIICYTKNSINVSNLKALYGLPETLLQNLIKRFNLGLIPDFYNFFCEPWSYAMYHDRFSAFRLKNKLIFESKQLPHEICRYFEQHGWSMVIDAEICDATKYWFTDREYEAELESNLQQFLTENSEYLPMYASHNVLRQLLCNLEDNPLFKEQEEE